MALTPAPTLTAEDLSDALKRPRTTGVEVLVQDAYDGALDLLEDATSGAFRPIPVSVMNSLVLAVARSLYESRTRSAFGGSQATQVQGETAQRPPRDPLAAAGPLLARYVVGIG